MSHSENMLPFEGNRGIDCGELCHWRVNEVRQFAAVHYFAVLDGKSDGGTRPKPVFGRRMVPNCDSTAMGRSEIGPNFTLLRSILLRFALVLRGSRRSACLFLFLVVADDAFHGAEAEGRAFLTAYCDGDGT